MNRFLSVTVCALFSIVLASCAGVDSRVYAPEQLKVVKAWFLEFSYDNGDVEKLQKSNGDSEVKVVNKGQSSRHLQLRDDLFYELKDKYLVPMTKNRTEADGRVQLLPIDSYYGFNLLTVTIVDKSGETIARLKIQNGDRNATFKDDASFTRYAAGAIAAALKQK